MNYNHLIVIDPQYDFCNPEGSLYVPNAEEDMKRLSKFIKKFDHISDITVTLDTHQYYQIFHKLFWIDKDGKELPDFTEIGIDDLLEGKYRTSNPDHMEWAKYYVNKLGQDGKYSLMIWPYHCIAGTRGATINEDISESVKSFALSKIKKVNYYFKGINPYTEHYSAMKPEVEYRSDFNDKSVCSVKSREHSNTALLDSISQADNIYIGGEALSHCVANTINDIIDFDVIDLSKLVVLTDTSSPVKGGEILANILIERLEILGIKYCKTTDII